MGELKVFVSSTCYDLSHIRADLYEFIKGQGHLPVLSEFNSFPVEPDENTLKNCLSNVGSADLMVLIIGLRYGSIHDGVSITNSEYLYAKSLGIPIFVFTDKILVDHLKMWENDPSQEFDDLVDSPKLFEFLKAVRDVEKHWCFNYEKTDDIIPALKIQLSNLFKKSLDLRKKYKIPEHPDYFQLISAKAIDIALKKGDLYEARFFAQVLFDELQKLYFLKTDLDFQIKYRCTGLIKDPHSFIDWIKENFGSVTFMIDSLSSLYKDAYVKFYAEPGHPSDLKGLYYVATSLARICGELISWSIKIQSTRVEEEFTAARDYLAGTVNSAIEEIWSYGNSLISNIEEGISIHRTTGKAISIDGTLTLTGNGNSFDLFTSELQRLQFKFFDN